MSSLLKSTLNTRALPTGNLRYIRSDYPGNLSKEEVNWLLKNNVVTVIDLREEKVPVHAPVPGMGTPTNRVSASSRPNFPALPESLAPAFSPLSWKKWQIPILECLMSR